MAMRSLMPWGRDDSRPPMPAQDRQGGPFMSLQREIDRLFDDFMQAWDPRSPTGSTWPSVEVADTDTAMTVTAELPGLTEKDVTLSVDNGVLCICGERRQESTDASSGYSERRYGRFERRFSLPHGVKEDEATARFQNGVLTVTMPKGAEAPQGRRIPINTETQH
ncbi:Hsp20/alpha crystallin family protein [Gluconacetobacter diazotrophicus]|uniref:Hsp20/alpha crystallin family protein n=3 Tax=Gluconacetobacter diazotrophicus TaxID=33996 RepID=A0A7W4FD37_GLUDI|nr:Hsp20/alpha crystallin family protein [Gluconacetobacter diazotrophicus]CAP55374.1 putative heat shock protein [Gluconacetobacter diazotrophicus PA1 5]